MSTLLNFGRDMQGMNAYAPQFPTDIFTATLTVGTGSSVTVPVSHAVWIMYVRVEPTGYVWCRRNGTAAVPAGNTFASASSELIVGTIEYKRTVYAGDVINFISSNATCHLEVALFQASYP